MAEKKETAAVAAQDDGNTSVAVVQASGYEISNMEDIAAAMSEEMEGMTLEFEKIKIPPGGGIAFEIPNADFETDMVKEFTGVIVYHHPLRSYYTDAYDGSKNPPLCGSYDGVTGNGVPGGNCSECLYNTFGSDADSKTNAKACKEKRRIYIVREGEVFPIILSLPVGSLPAFKKYITKIVTTGRRTHQIVTKFTLQKATNSGGIAYSQAVFTVDRILNEKETASMANMSVEIKKIAKSVRFELDADTHPDGVVSGNDTDNPFAGE